ncbi:hypothetical protein VNO77_45686 [Canavalia gladiata]|uniref:Uncharacterized protein n=1 Tax=Canavalia gladiata TaxID=3824 RepID=A0AAN9JIB5_CANGL
MAVVSSCRKTAGDKPEEGEDDVKSSCPLCPGRHTCYNGRDKGSRSREGELTPKTRPQFGLCDDLLHGRARGKESKSDSRSSGERNGSSLNRENGVVGELYKCRAARRSSRECCTLDGESPVAESITSLRSDPSSMGHVESRVNQQGPPCKAKYSWVTDSEVVPGEMPLEPRASWFSPKCVEAQQLTRHLGVKHCFGAGRESGTKSRQTLNTRYDLKITRVKVGQ